jgi:hypothetical protein
LVSRPEGTIWSRLFWRKLLEYVDLKKVLESWKQLHNEELHTSYCSLDITAVFRLRRIRPARNVAGEDEIKNAFKSLAGKAEQIIYKTKTYKGE